MRIAENGNLGIGTITPTRTLDVVSTAVASYFQGGNGGYSALTFSGNLGKMNGSLTTLYDLIYLGSVNSGGTGSNGEIIINATSHNVGIGTTNPLSKLVVSGNASILGTANGAEVLNLGTAGLINAVINTADEMYFNIDSDNSQTGASFHFGHNLGTYSSTELMRIQDNGNVGIGTDSPTHTLNVVGNVNVTGNIVAYENFMANGTSVSIGTLAGKTKDGNSTGNFITSIGYKAGSNNSATAGSVVILGYLAGINNIGSDTVIIGATAGQHNRGGSSVIIGKDAGFANTGTYLTAVGLQAGYSSIGSGNAFFGTYSGQQSNGGYLNGMGYQSFYQAVSTTSSWIGDFVDMQVKAIFQHM